MPNIMRTYTTVKNINQDVVDYLKSMCKDDGKGGHYSYTMNDAELINDLYGTNFGEETGLWDIKWGNENLGSKWIQFDYIEFNGDDITFNLESAWSVPMEFLEKLTEKLTSIHSECYITGTYEDEGYEPVGAFLYAKEWDDIEDLDEDIDFEKMWDDDEYRESIFDEMEELRADIENAYFEDLQDRIDNPQDYE